MHPLSPEISFYFGHYRHSSMRQSIMYFLSQSDCRSWISKPLCNCWERIKRHTGILFCEKIKSPRKILKLRPNHTAHQSVTIIKSSCGSSGSHNRRWWQDDINSSFTNLSALQGWPFTWGGVATETVITFQDDYLPELSLEIPWITHMKLDITKVFYCLCFWTTC